MSIWEIVLIGVALSMDAFAVGITNGLVEPKMKVFKVLLIALFFGGFQFLMPVVGYYLGSTVTVFVERIAPWLSFGLLAFIGGKMIFDCIKELIEAKKGKKEEKEEKKLGLWKLTVQAVATSIDALAVGVSFLAVEASVGLPTNVFLCSTIIGCTTFILSVVAVYLGKGGAKLGGFLKGGFAEYAELVGGLVLVGIGLKILIESFL